MTVDENQPAAPRPRFCTTCGARLEAADSFCPECGADISRQQTDRDAATTLAPAATASNEQEPAPIPVSANASSGVKKKRRRRKWYKRPLFIVPLVLLAILVLVGGVLGYRTLNAFNQVNDVSTPPPAIGGDALGGDEDLVIDTGPAQDAVREWEATHNAGTTDTEPTHAAAPTATTASEATDDADVIGPSGDGGARATAPSTRETVPSEAPTATVPANSLEEGSSDLDTGVNILLMGVDAREGEAIDIGVRPDSLGILNINEETGTCRILAVPRDSRVEIPGYGQSKVNHALAVGGVPFEMLVLEHYLGINIDHYALVDFSGLVAVVDAFGGITVDNPEAFEMSGHDFAAGEITLDGEQALLYTRYRGGSDGDFGRVAKQQQVLRALLDEANNQNLVNLVPNMWTLLHDHFRTDYGMLELLGTANDFHGVCTSTTLETMSIPGDVQTLPDDMMQMDLSFVVSDPAEVQASVAWLLTGDPTVQTDGAGTPEATPVATPAATPARESDRGLHFAWRQDHGW